MDTPNGKPTLSWSQPNKPASQNTQTPVASTPVSTSTPAVRAVARSEKSNMPTYAGIFVAGLVVGVLVGWGVTASKSNPTKVATNTSTSTSATNTTNTGAAALAGSQLGTDSGDWLTVASPQTAGSVVTISNVSITQPTWVAVYDNNNGAPGLALGAHLFFPGATSGTISLLRPTVSGKTYLIGEYVDNGDHKYSTSLDKAVMGVGGKQRVMQIQAN